MSNKKITDLPELTNPTTDDVFPIVDIATNTTLKVQVGNLPIQTAVATALATKQDNLVSGTNIKTINSATLLDAGDIVLQTPLVSGTNIKTINGVSLLGSGNIPVVTSPSGVSGAIQFSNGSAFASDAANLFWDDTNNRLGVGTNVPLDTINAKGVIRASRTDDTNSHLTMSAEGGFGRITAIGGIGVHLNEATTTVLQVLSGNVTIGNGTTGLGAKVGIKGSGSTSATTSLLVQNSAGTEALRVRDDGNLQITQGNAVILNNEYTTKIFSSGAHNLTFQDAGGNGAEFQWKANNGSVTMGTFTQSGFIIGSGTIQASAQFQIDSTNTGFLPPRMTNAQRILISSPAVGLMVYCTDAVEGLYINKSTGWTLVI
jgi:hypothetical protein